MKSTTSNSKRIALDESDERYTDLAILETLYEIGEKTAKGITSVYPDTYPLDEKDGYTASDICKRMGVGWVMAEGADGKGFSISVGAFRCKVSYDNIFGLITRFEKICKVNSSKKRKKFTLGAQ